MGVLSSSKIVTRAMRKFKLRKKATDHQNKVTSFFESPSSKRCLAVTFKQESMISYTVTGHKKPTIGLQVERKIRKKSISDLAIWISIMYNAITIINHSHQIRQDSTLQAQLSESRKEREKPSRPFSQSI